MTNKSLNYDKYKGHYRERLAVASRSGQPTLKEWEDAIELASQALSKQREGE